MSLDLMYLYMSSRREHDLLSILNHVASIESNLGLILFTIFDCNDDGTEVQLEAGQYHAANREYNAQQLQLVRQLINDLPLGHLRHHSIHCLSIRECMSTVIGLNVQQFAQLFYSLRQPLEESFPRSPETLEFGEVHNNCERRFKLFLCLFRLKQGCTYNQMEITFGWSASSLQEWCDIIVRILVVHLFNYHTGFLDYKGTRWQMNECLKWRVKHFADSESYERKITFQNNEAGFPLIDRSKFVGSIGAVDGTYSLQPRVGHSTLAAHDSDTALDMMYSEYKRIHAYKLVLVNSHGFLNEPKFLLWVGHGCGGASDAAVYNTFALHLSRIMIKEAVLLGDAAFHAQRNIIAPYTSSQIRANVGAEFDTFNHNHSSDRMTSEHGVRALKLWGAMRGREDSQLYQDEENFERALKAVWGLHNYIQDKCPIL